MTNAIIYCYLCLSCWKLILGEGVSKLFRNTPSVSKHLRWCWGWGGRSSNIQESDPPPLPRSALCPSNSSVHIINVSSQSHKFPNSECQKTVHICRFSPFCPNPPKQLPYVQLHLQAWTLGDSRFILGSFGSNCRNSCIYKPCISPKVVVGQSVIQPQEPCRTLGPDTSRFIVA